MSSRDSSVRTAHRKSLKKLYAIIQLLIEYHYDLVLAESLGDEIDDELARNLEPLSSGGIRDEPTA